MGRDVVMEEKRMCTRAGGDVRGWDGTGRDGRGGLGGVFVTQAHWRACREQHSMIGSLHKQQEKRSALHRSKDNISPRKSFCYSRQGTLDLKYVEGLVGRKPSGGVHATWREAEELTPLSVQVQQLDEHQRELLQRVEALRASSSPITSVNPLFEPGDEQVPKSATPELPQTVQASAWLAEEATMAKQASTSEAAPPSRVESPSTPPPASPRLTLPLSVTHINTNVVIPQLSKNQRSLRARHPSSGIDCALPLPIRAPQSPLSSLCSPRSPRSPPKVATLQLEFPDGQAGDIQPLTQHKFVSAAEASPMLTTGSLLRAAEALGLAQASRTRLPSISPSNQCTAAGPGAAVVEHRNGLAEAELQVGIRDRGEAQHQG